MVCGNIGQNSFGGVLKEARHCVGYRMTVGEWGQRNRGALALRRFGCSEEEKDW